MHEMTRDCALTNENTINLWLFNATSEQVGGPRRILTHFVSMNCECVVYVHCDNAVLQWKWSLTLVMCPSFRLQTHSIHKIIIAAAYTRYRYRLWICNEMNLLDCCWSHPSPAFPFYIFRLVSLGFACRSFAHLLFNYINTEPNQRMYQRVYVVFGCIIWWASLEWNYLIWCRLEACIMMHWWSVAPELCHWLAACWWKIVIRYGNLGRLKLA